MTNTRGRSGSMAPMYCWIVVTAFTPFATPKEISVFTDWLWPNGLIEHFMIGTLVVTGLESQG